MIWWALVDLGPCIAEGALVELEPSVVEGALVDLGPCIAEGALIDLEPSVVEGALVDLGPCLREGALIGLEPCVAEGVTEGALVTEAALGASVAEAALGGLFAKSGSTIGLYLCCPPLSMGSAVGPSDSGAVRPKAADP